MFTFKGLFTSAAVQAKLPSVGGKGEWLQLELDSVVLVDPFQLKIFSVSMIRAGRQLNCFVFLIVIEQSQCNWESLARDIAQIFAEYLKWLLCSHAGGSQLEVKLVLLWKHNMRIEYLAVTPWPLDPSKRSTWVEVTMEGSYDILHDISCTMRKPITSLYRTTVIRRFWNTLQRWAGPSSVVLSPV